MNSEDLKKTPMEKLKESVSIKDIYGEPIEKYGRTIIPVAKIMHCFGGRFSQISSNKQEDADGAEDGNCGCGCVKGAPTGVIEITEQDLRYIDFNDTKKMAMAIGAGICMGAMMSKKKFKKYKKYKALYKQHKKDNPADKDQE